MKNIRIFVSENFCFLAVKFSVYLNRRVLVMSTELRMSKWSFRGVSIRLVVIRLAVKLSAQH